MCTSLLVYVRLPVGSQGAALFTNLNTLQAQVAFVISPLLTSLEDGISASSPIGDIKMRKIRKDDANDYLSRFYNGSSQSSVIFHGIDAYFNDTKDVFAQVSDWYITGIATLRRQRIQWRLFSLTFLVE